LRCEVYAATVPSSHMAYATNSDMKVRYDVRRLGELVRDDGTKATAAQLESDTVLAAMITDAESWINAAVLTGKRYTLDDLEALAGTDKAMLTRLTCDLAYGFLVMRRGFTADEVSKMAPGFKLALAALESLKAGEMVFNDEDNINAGRTQRVRLSRNVTLVSSAQRLFGDLDIQERTTPIT
jgi:phage gp36-like protein